MKNFNEWRKKFIAELNEIDDTANEVNINANWPRGEWSISSKFTGKKE